MQDTDTRRDRLQTPENHPYELPVMVWMSAEVVAQYLRKSIARLACQLRGADALEDPESTRRILRQIADRTKEFEHLLDVALRKCRGIGTGAADENR